MSKCISRHGEFSDHELPGVDPFTCALCGVFDEYAAIAEIARLTAENERLRNMSCTERCGCTCTDCDESDDG